MPRVPKIAKLPPELRAWLRKALVDRGFGDIQGVTAELNEMLSAAGVSETVGKSAVGIEAQRIKRLEQDVRAATEAAQAIAEGSRDDADARSEALIATVQADVWKAMLDLREADKAPEPEARLRMLTKAATSVAEMSRARVNQAKRRDEVELRVKAAADAAAKLARKGGASAATIAEIKTAILGITKRLPA